MGTAVQELIRSQLYTANTIPPQPSTHIHRGLLSFQPCSVDN